MPWDRLHRKVPFSCPAHRGPASFKLCKMEVVPLKKLGPFVLGASAEEVRKAVKGPVISDEPETVDGQTYPATDLFHDRTRCEVGLVATRQWLA
jgi:hypothetical protein